MAFTIGAFVFFLGVLYTVVTTKEYPPEDLAAFEKARRETSGLGHAFREIFQGIGSMPGPMRKLALVQFFTWFGLFCLWIYFAPGVAKGIFVGPLRGLGMTLVRTVSGAGETLTFMIPFPGFFDPYFEPAYVWQKE